MNNIKLSYPWLFLLLIPLVLGVILPFIKIKKEGRKPKNIISLVIHLIICVLLTASIVDIKYLNSSNNTEFYVLADVSESTTQNYDKIDESIKKLSQQIDAKTKMGVVCFAKNYQLLTPLGGEIKSVKKAKVDVSATDLEGALKYTASLYKPNVIKKLLIISDGIETDNHAINAIEQLRYENINVDALYLNHPVLEDEVQINGVDYTQNAFLNKVESLKVAIQTGKTKNVTVELFKEDALFYAKDVTLTKGINIINFPLDTTEAGLHKYKVQVMANSDIDLTNNHKYFVQKITDNFKVLVIANRGTDYYSVDDLYNEHCILSPYFIDNDDVPYKLEELCEYDEIVLANANVVALSHHEEFVINLEKTIAQYGKSLITFGATYASGTSSPTMSKYNNMLPVQFESSDAKCVAIVIDASSSMNTDNRLDKAVEGAIACLDLLGENDKVAVISFGEKTEILQAPIYVKNHREQIIERIKSIKVSYATNMTKGLREAYNQIKDEPFDNKHVIVLSDGLPSEPDYKTTLNSVVTDMFRNNIVSSFININCYEGEELMESLAQIGTGSYYFIRDASEIVKVILTSVADVVTNSKVEGNFEIHTNRANDSLIQDVGDLPNIKGYNYSRIKSSANTVYTVTYTNELDGRREVPLLAYWTFGKGKVVSFTSDISSQWASNVKNSTNGKKLFSNVINYLEPRERIDTIFDININTKGFSTEINIELDLLNNGAYLEVNVFSPSNEKTTKYLRNETSSYSVAFISEELGLYRLELIYHNGDGTYSEVRYFDFSYSKEYDYFLDGDEQLLYRLVGENGHVFETLNYELLTEETSSRYYSSTSIYLLLSTVVLFIIDVMIRKLRLSDLKFIKRRRIEQ